LISILKAFYEKIGIK